MTLPLLTTKLYIPTSRPNLVPRQRLIGKLNEGFNRKLTLVSAPAGFGKTALVSSQITKQERPVAWISLDENDNDLKVFFTYFVAALQRIDLDLCRDTLITIQASQSLQVESLLMMMVNEIDVFGGELILVLDDYHLITNQLVHDSFNYLFEYMPLGMHLVIIGRTDPDFSKSRLRVSAQLTEIRTNDLRFTVDEAARFLNDLMDLNLTRDDITALERRTEGWIAGLQLAALSLDGRTDKHEFISQFSGSHHYIIDYLVEEVLSRHPEEIRTFLCGTSILEQFCAQLCDATLGISSSHDILQRLTASNLFLIPLDDHREWYRYHHLFADFLLSCLHDNPHESILNLHNRAAKWFQQNGFVHEALQQYLKAEDFESAADLVEGHARELIEHSEFATLLSWVDLLPAESVLAKPWLCVYHAWALRLSGSPFDTVESRLKDAERAMDNQSLLLTPEWSIDTSPVRDNETSRLMGHITAIRAFQAVYSDEIPRAVELANQAAAFRSEGTFLRSNIAFALGWAYRFSGDLDISIQAFNETSSLGHVSGNFYMAAVTKCRAAYGQVLAGKLHQAMTSLQEAAQIATREDGKQVPVAGYAYVYMGGLYHEWNDLETAASYSLNGIDLCKRVGYLMDQAVGYTNLSRIKLAQSDWDGAQDALKEAQLLSQKMKAYVYVRRWVESCQLRLWTAQGNMSAIARWTQECGLRVDDELTFLRDIEHLLLARAVTVLGRAEPGSSYLEDAFTLLARLLKLTQASGWSGKTIEVLVLLSLVLQAMGEQDRAMQSLEEALTLAKPEGYVRTFIDEGEPLAELLQLAAAQGIHKNYIGELLGAFDLTTMGQSQTGTSGYSSSAKGTSQWIEPLSNREDEVLRLLATDLSGPEIAQELKVALSTLRYHTNNIYSKLSVHNRREAVSRAIQLGLL